MQFLGAGRLALEQHRSHADRDDRHRGADPVGEGRPGRRDQVAQAHELVAEQLLAGAAVRHQRVHGCLVLFHEADDRELPADDVGVAGQDLGPGLGGGGLAGAPRDDLLQLGPVVLDEAADDVLFGLEVVVQGGLGDAEPFRDLPQRGLLVALLGEQLQRDRLDALPGSAASELARRPVACRGLTAGRGPTAGRRLTAGRADATGAVPVAGTGPIAGPAPGGAGLQRRGRAHRGYVSRLIHGAAPRTPSAKLTCRPVSRYVSLFLVDILTGRQVGSEYLAAARPPAGGVRAAGTGDGPLISRPAWQGGTVDPNDRRCWSGDRPDGIRLTTAGGKEAQLWHRTRRRR